MEEEHGLLDSYIEEGVADNDMGAASKREDAVVANASYTLQVNSIHSFLGEVHKCWLDKFS